MNAEESLEAFDQRILHQQQDAVNGGIHLSRPRSSHQENGNVEIYESEQLSSMTKPWWTSSLFVARPLLFGTWDGVFTSCMINMFGVVVFLRTGWMVGNAGVGYSILIIVITESIALVTILSSIGICERCHVDGGGIYSLISRVLGNRIGASIGIVYCFGQAVACSLCVLAFGESITDLLDMYDDVWVTRAIAAGLLVILVGINVAGVMWVIGLQLVFVILLFVSVLDFVVGSFVRMDQSKGIVGYRWQTFVNNSGPNFQDGETFFTVFGVFFPSVCGAFAGFNMSGDLKDPKTNIAIGTLTALAVCSAIYVIFTLILGATCLTSSLQRDFLIADKLSATRVFWIIGLYELSISSAAGNISGPPNILQAIAADQACSVLEPIAQGRGPNKNPVIATLFFALVSVAFIFIGQLNTLGPILTMPFLLTYASVDYAHFILKTTFQMKQNRLESETQPDMDERSVLQLNHKGYNTFGGSSQGSQSDLTDAELDSLFQTERCTGGLCDPQLQNMVPSALTESFDEMPSSEYERIIDDDDITQRSSNDDKHDEAKVEKPSINPIFCNRWISLTGAVVNIAAMFGIQWEYALANVIIAFALWLIIGMTNSFQFPGIGEFSLLHWVYSGLRDTCYRARHKKRRPSASEKTIVMSKNEIFQTKAGQISDENKDFADRERYHQTEVIGLTPPPLFADDDS